MSLPPKPFIDLLPNELIDEILQDLPRSDISSLRLSCKFLANFGVKYLLTEAHAILTLDSFHQLLETSKSPVAQEYVTSLFWEGDSVPELYWGDKMTRWKQMIETDLKPHEQQYSIASAYDRAEFARKYAVRKSVGQQGQMTTQAFAQYLRNVKMQGIFDRLDKDALIGIVRGFPHLRSITLSLRNGIRSRTDDLTHAFSTGLYPAWKDENGLLGPINSVIAAILTASRKIKSIDSFHCGYITCKPLGLLSLFPEILGRLKNLSLAISSRDDDDTRGSPDSQGCAQALSDLSLHLAIECASNLQELKIHFEWDEPYPANFLYVVSSSTWSSLRRVDFGSMGATEDILINFFERHAATIRDLSLSRFKITQGSWASALPRLQSILALYRVNISGYISSEELKEYWYLDDGPGMHQWEASRTKRAIERYLLHGGECPLHRPFTYPMTRAVALRRT